MAKKILYIGNILSRHGYTATTVETLGPLLESEGFELLYASSEKNPLLRLLSMLWAIVKNRNKVAVVLIDTYSSSAFFFAWSSAIVCRLSGIAYMPILHGGNLPERIRKSPRMSRQLFAHSYTNIVISGYLQQCLKDNNYKNALIRNNIDLGLYPFLHRQQARPRILWVRAFHSIYNPQLAIYTLKNILQQYPDARLTMVGPEKDGTMELCKQLSGELGMADKVTFTGRLTKAEWIQLSADNDIFINTTDFDNLPVSVIEALALGMPVVSTNVGGIPYLVKNDENGLLVNPRSADEMTGAITRLLRDTALTAKLSRKARETAESYDWSIVRKEWHALLDPHL